MIAVWRFGVNFLPLAILAGVIVEVTGRRNKEHVYSTPAPRFQETEDNYTYHKGERAILYCSVKHLGTRKVTWRRVNESLFLSAGSDVITGDSRFQIAHIDDSTDWNLMISNLTTDDSGTYECQISSIDKALRKLVYLNVKDEFSYAEPRISISGTLHVDRGMKMTLVCNASGAITPPDSIDWFKDGIKLVPNRSKQVEMRKKMSINARTITSILTKESAEMTDTGTYSCRTSDLQIISEKVNVLRTDKAVFEREPNGGKASMTLDESLSSSTTTSYSLLTLILSLLYTYYSTSLSTWFVDG